MAGRTIEKGWVVPQPLGIALILVMISGTAFLYWRIIDKQDAMDKVYSAEMAKQHELLVRLDQRLIDKQAQDEKNEHDRKNKDELQDLELKNVNNQLLVLNDRKKR